MNTNFCLFNQTKTEKDEKYSPKTFKLRRSSKPPFHASISLEMMSKSDSSEAKTSEPTPNKSLEIASFLNGLQGNVNGVLGIRRTNVSYSGLVNS